MKVCQICFDNIPQSDEYTLHGVSPLSKRTSL
jgi:hypothetical protein